MLRRGLGLADLVLLVLGANVLVSFLLVPMLHQSHANLEAPIWASIVPLLALVAGVVTLQRWVLLLVFPCSLLLPLSLRPELSGRASLSPSGFLMLGIALLAFIFGAAWVASASRQTPLPHKRRPLPGPSGASKEKHQRRLRIYGLFALACVAFPTTLIYALYLSPDAAELVATRFPQRGAAASLLFGVLIMVLWLAIFLKYIATPLRDHIRGDRKQRRVIKSLARRMRSYHVRLGLILYLLLAAGGLWIFWLHQRTIPPS